MNEVLEITSVMIVDVCLWTETTSNTRYFEKYGFESIGKRGRAKENLMIKKKRYRNMNIEIIVNHFETRTTLLRYFTLLT